MGLRAGAIPFIAVGVVIVLPAAIAVMPTVVDELTDDDRVFSLCPADRDATEVVQGSKMIEDAPAYAGKGPHRIIVDGPTGATDGLPEHWVPSRESNGAYRVGELELAACEYRYAVGHEGDLETCTYTPIGGGPTSSFTARSAKYDYRVYEAATGNLLTSFTLDAAASSCADFRTVYGDSPQHSTFAGYPDYTELRRRLEPLVTRARP